LFASTGVFLAFHLAYGLIFQRFQVEIPGMAKVVEYEGAKHATRCVGYVITYAEALLRTTKPLSWNL
jgi:hypothetical protein